MHQTKREILADTKTFSMRKPQYEGKNHGISSKNSTNNN